MGKNRISSQVGLLGCLSDPSFDSWPDSEEHGHAEVTRWQTGSADVDAIQIILAKLSMVSAGVLPEIEHSLTLADMQRRIAVIEKAMSSLTSGAAISVPIQSLAPEPYELLKPFRVIVVESDGEYIASFYDANLSASGDTSEEAVLNLKDTIVAVFEMLNSTCPENLGPGPARQIAVLREFIRER